MTIFLLLAIAAADAEEDPEPEFVFVFVFEPVPDPVVEVELEPVPPVENGAKSASVAGPAAVCRMIVLPEPEEGLSAPTAQMMLVLLEGVDAEGSVKVIDRAEELRND